MKSKCSDNDLNKCHTLTRLIIPFPVDTSSKQKTLYKEEKECTI